MSIPTLSPTPSRRRALVGLTILSVLLRLASHAWAITPAPQSGPNFVVYSTADTDSGACGATSCALREAINAANKAGGSHTITFASNVKGTITLSKALPNLSSNITLRGPGAKVLTVSGHDAVRVFTISNGTSIGPTVSISGLTIAHGKATGNYPANFGGGLYNDHGTLSLSNCAFAYNAAGYGGGLFNDGGYRSATANLTNCAFAHNSATLGGGLLSVGAFGGSASANLSNCTVAYNVAGNGGGLYNDGSHSGSASASLSNCTIAYNAASHEGGGLYNDGDGNGRASVNLSNCTVAYNQVSVVNYGDNGRAVVTLNNTILYRGAGSGTNLHNIGGTITSRGYNLSNDDESAFLNKIGDKNKTDPKLDPAGLKDNGGPTPTIALLSTSPAIDGGNSTLPTDQRGVKRPFDLPNVMNARGGNGSDIGAFELQATNHADYAPANALSTATASGATNSIMLQFRTALEAASASDASHYTVTVNGHSVAVDSVGYNATSHTVTLSLPDGALQAGDTVMVEWSGLSDSNGTAVTGQSGAVAAR